MLTHMQQLQKQVSRLIRELQNARVEINHLQNMPPPPELNELKDKYLTLEQQFHQAISTQQTLQQQTQDFAEQQSYFSEVLSQKNIEITQLQQEVLALQAERDQLIQKNRYAKQKVQSIISRLHALTLNNQTGANHEESGLNTHQSHPPVSSGNV